MRQLLHIAVYVVFVAMLLSCSAPKEAPSDYQSRSGNSNYGTFGNDDEVTILSLDETSTEQTKQEQLQAKQREEERRLEQKRREIAAAQKEREKEKEREANRQKDRERLSNTSGDLGLNQTSSANRTNTSSTASTNSYSNTSSYSSTAANSYTSSGVNTAGSSYPRQYSNTIYPTKARLKAINKTDEPKLKKYNVVVASLLMEQGADKLMETLKKANEPYFVAKSGSYFTFIVGSFDKKEDAIAYRIKILDKYPRKYSEEELFNTYGIIFSDTWVLEAI